MLQGKTWKTIIDEQKKGFFGKQLAIGRRQIWNYVKSKLKLKEKEEIMEEKTQPRITEETNEI